MNPQPRWSFSTPESLFCPGDNMSISFNAGQLGHRWLLQRRSALSTSTPDRKTLKDVSRGVVKVVHVATRLFHEDALNQLASGASVNAGRYWAWRRLAGAPRGTPSRRAPSRHGVHATSALVLVRDQHLTNHAQTAGLSQRDKTNRLDVNDERNLANACLGFTPRTSSESLAGIGIEHERVSRRQCAHPRR